MTYVLKDITVIIPTYNRKDNVMETLKHIPNTIKEIIIVDQSKPVELTDLHMRKDIPIHIMRSEVPSITIARNKGLQWADSKLIAFIDDDVSVTEKYFEGILDIFNKYPDVEGVAGWNITNVSNMKLKMDAILRGPFGLRVYGEPTLRWPYSNRYPSGLTEPVQAQWMPGMNMVYKTDILDKHNMRFDENLLGYTLAEDIDFTYRIFKRNPKGLIITPHAPIIHRDAATHRQDVKKISYINQVDHLYFAMKHNMIGKWWYNIFWITILRTLMAPVRFSKWRYYMSSLGYCLTHWKLIKQGKVREWQN
jgi:glycosyltransferase involved in cell wall biosynthesis